MENFQLTSKQLATLRALHKTLRDRRLADRVKEVVLFTQRVDGGGRGVVGR